MFSMYNKLLEVILNKIIPETKISVLKGNKIFGAAIISKDDYSLVVAGSNNEMENPIWHGEIHTIKKY